MSLALLIVALAVPKLASARDIYRFSGKTAIASFSSSAPCGFTGVYLSASENVDQSPPGSPNSSSAAFISIFSSNYCDNTYSVGYGNASDVNFQMDHTFTNATLQGTINVFFSVYPYGYSVKPVAINMVWTGTGDLVRQINNEHLLYPGGSINVHSNGSFRSAEAVGSVSDGTTNFTQNPGYGSMGITREHQVTVN